MTGFLFATAQQQGSVVPGAGFKIALEACFSWEGSSVSKIFWI